MIDIRESPTTQPKTDLKDPPLTNSLELPRIPSGTTLPIGSLDKQQNLADLPNPTTARNNLGLGSIAIFAYSNIYENLTLTHATPTIYTIENRPLFLVPHGEGYVVIGADATSNHSLQSNEDLLVNGIMEVHGVLYADQEIRTRGSVIIGEPGQGLWIKDGTADCTMGVATLVGGTKVVSNTLVTANTRIFLTCQTPGGTPGALYVAARTANTSFTITSTSGTDTSTVAYLLVEPI